MRNLPSFGSGSMLALVSVLALGCGTTQRFSTTSPEPPLPSLQRLGRIGLYSTGSVPRFQVVAPPSREEVFQANVMNPEAARSAMAFTPPQLAIGIGAGALAQTAVAGVKALILGHAEGPRNAADLFLRAEGAHHDVQEKIIFFLGARLDQTVPGAAFVVEKPLPAGLGPEVHRFAFISSGTFGWLPTGRTPRHILGDAGADTALEILFRNPGLYPARGGHCLRLPATVRLWRVADGREISRFDVFYQSKAHSFTRWAATDAALFRRELADCAEEVSLRIAAKLLAPSHLPESAIVSVSR